MRILLIAVLAAQGLVGWHYTSGFMVSSVVRAGELQAAEARDKVWKLDALLFLSLAVAVPVGIAATGLAFSEVVAIESLTWLPFLATAVVKRRIGERRAG